MMSNYNGEIPILHKEYKKGYLWPHPQGCWYGGEEIGVFNQSQSEGTQYPAQARDHIKVTEILYVNL